MKVLLLGPDFNLQGGVANYYRVIKLHHPKNFDYFPVGSTGQKPSLPVAILKLVFLYWRFDKLLLTKPCTIVHVNPSLDFKSFYREAVFLFIAHAFQKKTIIFFRGWQEPFEEKIKNNRLINTLFRLTYSKADTFIVLGALFKNKLLSMRVETNKKFIIETTIADDKCLSLLYLEKKINSFKARLSSCFFPYSLEEIFILILLVFYKTKPNIVIARPDGSFVGICALYCKLTNTKTDLAYINKG